jgi:hypothetical protein
VAAQSLGSKDVKRHDGRAAGRNLKGPLRQHASRAFFMAYPSSGNFIKENPKMKDTGNFSCRLILVTVSVLSVWVISANHGYAQTNYTANFNALYGTSGPYTYTPVLGSCLTCHSSGSQLNRYATDWKNNAKNFRTIEPLDSDGDGFTNITEITARTFPGDSNSKPAAANQAPIANAGPDRQVNEKNLITLDGSGCNDPDGTIAAYAWAQTGGTPAVVLSNASTARPSFTAPDVGPGGAALTFQLTVTDNSGATAVDTCIVNVSWMGIAPSASAGLDKTAGEGTTVTLDGRGSADSDGSITAWLWKQTGTGPTVTLSNASSAAATFVAPAVGSGGVVLTFELTVTDNEGLQSTDTVVVSISDSNHVPTADAGADQTVNEKASVALNGSNSNDPDGTIATYAWVQTGGVPIVILSSASTARPSFTAPDVGPAGAVLTFRLTVTDNNGATAVDTCIVNVSWVGIAPTASAGPDKTANEGTLVTLDGRGSADSDGAITAWLWKQTGTGPTATLSSASSAAATFVAPAVGSGGVVLTFELTVTDNEGLQATGICAVSISNVNQVPAADAGTDQTVGIGDAVRLNGLNSSDPDGLLVSYSWRQIQGSPVLLNDSTLAGPSFTAPDIEQPGESLVFELTVTDNDGAADIDTCIVNVSRVNRPPGADAGPDLVTDEGTWVTLSGHNSSDPDGSIVSYSWVQTGGTPTVDLVDPFGPRPSFTAPDVGPEGAALTFELTVTDDGGLIAVDTCIVNISWVNQPPSADAGVNQTVSENVMVMLDAANSSDPDDGILRYRWKQINGAQVVFSDPSAARCTFTAPDVGTEGDSLVFEVTVTDKAGLMNSARCTVNVLWQNMPPIASAGSDAVVSEGTLFTLDGSLSNDMDDGINSYLWTQIQGPPVILSDSRAIAPTFVAPEVGMGGEAIVMELTVTDNGGLIASDRMTVNITWQNAPPSARAGVDAVVTEGTTAILSGSNSDDPDDGIAEYHWTQIQGSPVTLSDPTAMMLTFVAPPVDANGSDMVFQLTVTDNGGLRSDDTVLVHNSDNGITGFPDDVLALCAPEMEPLGLKQGNDGRCTRLEMVDPGSLPASEDKPENIMYGLVDMDIKVDTPGGTTTLTFYITSPAPEGYKWYKYDSNHGTWSDYSEHTRFNDARDQIAITLTDGGIGDDDHTINGIIRDPSGLGVAPVANKPEPAADGGSGGGGCFIDTLFLSK